MRGMTKGGKRLLLVLTIMSAMLLAAAVPSMAQTRRASRISQVDTVENYGEARAQSGRNRLIGSTGSNYQDTVQDSLTDGLGEGGLSDNVATNEAEQVYDSVGTSEYGTGFSDAWANDSDTVVDQLATNDNVSDDLDDDDSEGDGAGSSIVQDALVDNYGDATAESGQNVSTGSSVESTQILDQIGDAVGEDGSPVSDVLNDGVQDVIVDGLSEGETGESLATGNTSVTDVVQDAEQIHDDISAGEDGTGSEVDQIADVTNEGEAYANSGGNQGVGASSSSEQISTQTSTAVSTSADTDEDDDDSDDSSLSSATNRLSSRNSSVGTARLMTGGSEATGNSSTTTVVSTSSNTSTTVDG